MRRRDTSVSESFKVESERKRIMSIRIIGTGSALPERKVTNGELAERMDTSDEWIRERTGIAGRYVSDGETVAALMDEACRHALEDAGKRAEDVELLIAATCSPESLLPCTACQVQARLGAVNAAAFDLNAACAGFLFALHTAWAYVEAGVYKNALVAGGEVLSKIVDWTDRSTCILFGDGAGAVMVEKCESGGILSFVQHADGSRGQVLQCERGGFVRMEGREVFAFAVRQVPAAVEEALDKAGLSPQDVDLYVLHQANKRIIEGIAKRLSVDISRFPMNLSEVGNTSSAAIPLLLDELNKKGRLRPGMTLMLSGFGAGLTYGACVLKW